MQEVVLFAKNIIILVTLPSSCPPGCYLNLHQLIWWWYYVGHFCWRHPNIVGWEIFACPICALLISFFLRCTSSHQICVAQFWLDESWRVTSRYGQCSWDMCMPHLQACHVRLGASSTTKHLERWDTAGLVPLCLALCQVSVCSLRGPGPPWRGTQSTASAHSNQRHTYTWHNEGIFKIRECFCLY